MKRQIAQAVMGAVIALAVSVAISPFTTITLSFTTWLALSGAFLVIAGAGYVLEEPTSISFGVVAFVFAGFAWWAPFWQTIAYGLFIHNPGGWQWLIVSLLLSLIIGLLSPLVQESDSFSRDEEMTLAGNAIIVILFIGLVGFFILGPAISGMYANAHMAEEIQESSTEIESPPESVTDHSRIAPKGVSRNRAVNSLQYPRYNLDGGDITYINGTPYWSFSLSPDGLYNSFTRQQRGAVYVNQSTVRKDITIQDDQNFRYGKGVYLTDSYDWQIKQQDYWKSYRDGYVVPHNDSSYLVVPYETHEWEFNFPIVYPVPEFGGVKIVDQEGNIEDVPASEVESHPVLEGQNYYPYDLARFRVESMAYKHGILNTIAGHEDQIELAPVPGDGNSQPFTIPTEDGPTYLVAVEPWGDANGIYQIWTVDAQTGEMRYTQFNQTEAFRGPRKAVDSIMAAPELSRLNDVEAVEPIPVIRNGTLYWQVRIIPESSARVTYVAFFNADTEEVTVVETTADVRAFLEESQVGRVGQAGGETVDNGSTSLEGCDIRLTLEYPNGTTETTCAPSGSFVTINSTAESTGGEGREGR